MNDLINWLRAQPSALLVCLGGLLIVTVLIFWTLLGYKKDPRWWLGSSVLPLVGWRLVCALGVLPSRQRSAEEVVPEQAASLRWGGLAIMFLALSMLTGCSWMSLNNPQLPGWNEEDVRSTILQVVDSLEQSDRSRNFGQPEIAQIDGLGTDKAAHQRMGRVIVKHNLGRDVYEVKLSWADVDRGLWQVEVMRDKSEALAPKSWRVRERLQEELARSPQGRNLGLSAAQLAALPVSETSPDPTQTVRQGEVHLPASAGEPPRVVKFLVHWCDVAQSCPGIQMIDGELPMPDSASFQHELKHAVEDWPQFRENRDTYGRPSWTQIEPLLFDAEQQQRFYRVQVRHAQGELPLSVVHQWKNREQGLWEVKILEP